MVVAVVGEPGGAVAAGGLQLQPSATAGSVQHVQDGIASDRKSRRASSLPCRWTLSSVSSMLRGSHASVPARLQPAVVAAVTQRAEDESLIVRLTLPPGVSNTFHENDMLMLSKDNPEVGRAARGVVPFERVSCADSRMLASQGRTSRPACLGCSGCCIPIALFLTA